MQIRFRSTVEWLMVFWAIVPAVLLSAYLLWQFNRQAIEQGTVQLQRESGQVSVELERSLLQIQNQLIRLSEQGAIVRSATVSFLSQKAVAQMDELRLQFPSVDAVMLLDIDQFQMETSPDDALKVDISDLETFNNGILFRRYNLTLSSATPSMSQFTSTKLAEISLRNTHYEYIAFGQPIIRSTESLSQPFVTDGVLLVFINLDALIKQVAAKTSIDLSTTNFRLNDGQRSLFQTDLSLANPITSASSEVDFSLGEENQTLAVQLDRSESTLRTGVAKTIQRFSIIMLLFIVGIIVLASMAARRLTKPIFRLQRETYKLTRGNYEAVESISTFKEFQDLSELLSNMGGTIENQFSQLNSSKLDLEAKVRERTQELQVSISKLKYQSHLLRGLMQVTVDMQRSREIDSLLSCSLNELDGQFDDHACAIVLNRTASHEAHQRLNLLPEDIQNYLQTHLDNWRVQDFDFRTDTLNEHTWTLVPIRNVNRDVVGQLIMYGPELTVLERDVVFIMTRLMATMLEQLSLTLKLEKLANSDALTGLANRHFFESQFKVMKKSWLSHQTPVGLVVVDINRLKYVNDTFGHESGDEMIQLVANRLVSICRENDTLARVGGDEFYILLHDADETLCQLLSERLEDASKRLTISVSAESRGYQQLPISYSIGYACTDQTPFEELIAVADQRMYQAKQASRSDQKD